MPTHLIKAVEEYDKGLRECLELVVPPNAINQLMGVIHGRDLALLAAWKRDVLESLPEEKIIHSYMVSPDHPDYAWNEYRGKVISLLSDYKLEK